MLSLLFQKSLSRSLEGQRERGENREIEEETRTASPAGAEGTRGDAGGPLGAHRGSAPAEEERQEEGGWAPQPGRASLRSLTHPCRRTHSYKHTCTERLAGGSRTGRRQGCRQADGRASCLGSWWERERP